MPEIEHTQESLDQLRDALKTSDIDKITALLKQGSLLSGPSVSPAVEEFIVKNMELLASQCNPVIIFELIAAGFKLPMLAYLFDSANNKLGLQVLLRLIPQLGVKELEMANALEDLDLDKCTVTLEVAKIPVRIDRSMLDFNAMMGPHNGNKFTMMVGNLNKPLIQQMQSISLDLQYITAVKKALNTQLANHDNSDSDLQISACLIEHFSDPLKKELIKVRNWELLLVCMVLLIQLYGNVSSQAPYTHLVASNMVYVACDIFLLWRLYQIQILIDDLLNMRATHLPVSEFSLTLKNGRNVEQLKTVKEFDFAKARNELPIIIGERFKEQYKEEDKRPGLLFWKQVFEERAKLITAEPNLGNECTEKSALQLAM